MLRFLMPLVAVTGLGCPAPRLPIPDADAGTLDLVGRACSVDVECGALRCDGIRRQCICLSDESCRTSDPAATPKYCNNYTGLCVAEIAGCTSNAQCGQTEFCDPTIRACRPLKTFCQSCANDAECGGAGDNCVLDTTLNQTFCGQACMTTADCPRGATCQQKGAAKQCWPDRTAQGLQATCRTFVGCTPDSLRSCNASTDCGDASQRCDPAQGKCVAIQRVCAFGTICDPRVKLCVAACAADQDCGDPKLRCNNKVCELINDCTTDTDCADNRVCTRAPGAATGTCQPFCQSDAACPLGQICDRQGQRFACVPGCTANTGCPLDQRCNTTTKQCEGPMAGGKRICQATSACGACEVCDGVRNECGSAKTQFPHCQPCSAPGDCSGGSCVAFPSGSSHCARFCGTGQECPQGFACLSLTTGGQACIPADRSCTGKCP